MQTRLAPQPPELGAEASPGAGGTVRFGHLVFLTAAGGWAGCGAWSPGSLRDVNASCNLINLQLHDGLSSGILSTSTRFAPASTEAVPTRREAPMRDTSDTATASPDALLQPSGATPANRAFRLPHPSRPTPGAPTSRRPAGSGDHGKGLHDEEGTPG
ncbi:hypothetical protein GCM10023403_56910 [Pseudonocardia benzenivorans]|nr:hypothetical protein PSD17_66030 [Pseudonocardia sp. D17]